MKRTMVIGLCLVLAASFAAAKKVSNGNDRAPRYAEIEVSPNVSDRMMYPVPRTAAQNVTTYLAYYKFEDACGCACDTQGWTSVDITAQPDYFHVTAFTAPPDECGPGNGGLVVPQGAQALWCGACPSGADPLCTYAALPGYGNGWNQAFCSPCVSTEETSITVDYYVSWDSEPGYDYTYLEWDACDGVYMAEPSVNDGRGHYDYSGSRFESININLTGPFSLRFHFMSDGAWSDEDGLWNTDGAIIVDSLTVRDSGGVLVATETFEDEMIGSTTATDWFSCTPPGFGDLAELTRAVQTSYQNNPVQEDPCASNFTCLWTFFKNSTYDYACNTPDPSPQQKVVPYGNTRGQYASTTIRSPWIPLAGSGISVILAYDVYRDIKMDALVLYNWAVRSKIGETGCPTGFVDRVSLGYFGDGKDWYHGRNEVGDLLFPGATHIQVALSVIDGCPYWCGLVGSGQCHSHGPMFDNVALYRVNLSGPQFSVRDLDMFQDTFASDGTTTGTCRADMAQDILPVTSTGITAGDSAKITVADPEVGLGSDSYIGCGPAVYCYLSVDPANYAASAMQAPETRGMCGVRYPWVTTAAAAGRTWEVYRMDSSFTRNGGLRVNEYVIDFNDNLFVPGDTCWFFFGAKNAVGEWSYYSLPYGQSNSVNVIAGAPDEFTMLPAVGDEPGNDILYVDGFNFRGAQPYFDTAFENMNLSVDRYDIRGPSSGAGNRPGSRVRNVLTQLIPIYNKIIWNTGDLTLGCIGDGVGYEKSDDATMLFQFCDHHSSLVSGVYFSGDDLAEEWTKLTGPGAIALRAYMSYTLANSNHVDAGAGINPAVVYSPGGTVFLPSDSTIVHGGCPGINDFDVISPNTPTSTAEMDYARDTGAGGTGARVPSAVLAQQTANAVGNTVRVVLSGFSYHFIRDIDNNGIADRYTHLHRILSYLNNEVDVPIAVRPNTRVNSLAQNYPNPFNPTTTIKYTLKERAHVSLKVYNVAGQLVCTLVDEVQSPEAVTPVEWRGLNNSGQQVSSGVYFYKLVTKGFTQTKKMVLLK